MQRRGCGCFGWSPIDRMVLKNETRPLLGFGISTVALERAVRRSITGYHSLGPDCVCRLERANKANEDRAFRQSVHEKGERENNQHIQLAGSLGGWVGEKEERWSGGLAVTNLPPGAGVAL